MNRRGFLIRAFQTVAALAVLPVAKLSKAEPVMYGVAPAHNPVANDPTGIHTVRETVLYLFDDDGILRPFKSGDVVSR